MDLFKPVFKFLFFLVVIAVLGLFGTREYLIIKTFNLVNNDYKDLYRLYTAGGKSTECTSQFGSSQTKDANIYQLRFTDRQTYVLEVLCGAISTKAITLKEVRLPTFVTRTPIGSGFIANHKDISEIVGFGVFKEAPVKWQDQVLELLPFLSKDFYLMKSKHRLEKLSHIDSTKLNSLAVGPKTSCAGNGYYCCNPVTSLGQGRLKTEVLDCSNDCYVACKPRPVVLAFNASNDYDPYLKTVTLTGGSQSVSFAVIVDSQGSKIASVKIDFGDGQSVTLSGEGPFEASHNYLCNQTECNYEAKATAVTTEGVASYLSSVSKIQVRVRR